MSKRHLYDVFKASFRHAYLNAKDVDKFFKSVDWLQENFWRLKNFSIL